MKRITACILIIGLALALVACGGNLSKPANGTYKSAEGLISKTWTFSGNNDITQSSGGGLITTTGTYSINGTKLTVIVTSKILEIESTIDYTITEITPNSFFIDGTKFVKQ